MSGWRLPDGGGVDRSRPLSFRFDGREYCGFHGDTLASALIANGVRVVGRSFRLHRPRGILGAGSEEPNAIVQLGRGAGAEPNLKATEIPLVDGMEAFGSNAWPSVRFDVAAAFGLISGLLPPGFYYKTFKWPRWKLFAGPIRQMGGIGRAPDMRDPDRYEEQYGAYDVVVVGAGPAGIEVATALANERPQRILLVDQGRSIAPIPGITTLAATTVFGWYDHDLLGMVQHLDGRPVRQRLWKVRAGRVILATGAIERPLVFPDNDRPGIMLADAARIYVERYGVAPGRRVVVATNNDSAYQSALVLADAGISVLAVIDVRPGRAHDPRLEARGIELLSGWAPSGTSGRSGLRRITAAPVEGGYADTACARSFDCDLLLMSGGWNPVAHLYSHAGGKLDWDPRLQAFVPPTGVGYGAVAGDTDTVEPLWEVRTTRRRKAWVDFLNDVTADDIRVAALENYQSVEHLKRYTTLGMGLDQGKTSNVNAIGILAAETDREIAQVGTTRFRPPYTPVTLGVLAAHRVGQAYRPLRRLPAHFANLSLGAVMEDYGGWQRPAYYSSNGNDEDEAVERECLAVRNAVGLYDASPLGKIEVSGPDAETFLDRMLMTDVRTLKPGRCRYGLMLEDDGRLWDDGVIVRLAHERFLVGTTTARADAAALRLEEWRQCEWPDLSIAIEPVTTQWATINLAGPQAFAVLGAIGADIDDIRMPHMSMLETRIGALNARVARISFTGERSYEINVPASEADALWDACMSAGRSFGILPFGVEAIMRLRLEKGYLHFGTDTEATSYPQDIGWGHLLDRKTRDFVGRTAALQARTLGDVRRELVGVEAVERREVLSVGSHVIGQDSRSCGWLTSAAWSATLDRSVALALVDNGQRRIGEEITLLDRGRHIRARLCSPCALDPEGVRLVAH